MCAWHLRLLLLLLLFLYVIPVPELLRERGEEALDRVLWSGCVMSEIFVLEGVGKVLEVRIGNEFWSYIDLLISRDVLSAYVDSSTGITVSLDSMR